MKEKSEDKNPEGGDEEEKYISYNEKSEKKFLKELGTGKFSNCKSSRLELLVKYKDHMLTRVRFGAINKIKLLSIVILMISDEAEKVRQNGYHGTRKKTREV